MKKKYIIPALRTVELGSEALMLTVESGVNNAKPSNDNTENIYSDASAWDSSIWSGADED